MQAKSQLIAQVSPQLWYSSKTCKWTFRTRFKTICVWVCILFTRTNYWSWV